VILELAFVFKNFGLQISISALRQPAYVLFQDSLDILCFIFTLSLH
jgi:hypothetical protein